MWRGLLTLLVSGCLAACGGSGSAADADLAVVRDLSPLPLFNVHVDYDYQGKQVGKFGVGAFRDNPPMGAPLSYVRIGSGATFPGSVELRGLEPGSFYVYAVLDFPPDNPTVPGPTDLTVASPLVSIVSADIDVTLVLKDK